MANPELLATGAGPDLFGKEDTRPVEGKSFDNLLRFMAEGTVFPVKHPQGQKPNYSDKAAYFPFPKRQSIGMYNRNFEILGEYLGLDLTLEEVGKSKKRTKKVTRERARQLVEYKIKQLYEAAPQEIQSRFPFESFDFAKPLSLTLRQRSSEVHGGTSLEIARRLGRGASLYEIKSDFSTSQITTARQTLRGWGIDLEREVNPILHRFEGLRNPEANDQEIQALLNGVAGRRQVEVLKKAGLVVGLLDVARKAGLYLTGREIQYISESLEREKLPQAKVPNNVRVKLIGYHHIIAAADEQKAIIILQRDHNLDDLRINPVTLLAGPKGEKLPNTNELIKSGEYEHLGKLIGDIWGARWIGRGKGGLITNDIIKGLPFEIYGAHDSIYYRKSEGAQVRAEIETRMRALGMI